MEKNNKAIWIGLLLIVGVAVFTFIRPLLGQKKESAKESDSSLQDMEQYSFISAIDLEKQYSEMAIFDSRQKEEFANEHLAGSFNVSPEDVNQYLPKVNPGQKIIVVGSDSGDLSAKQLAQKLEEKGVKNFAILSGGLNSWIEGAGRTVRRGNPNSLADQAKINLVKAEDLKSALDTQDKKILILDLRSSSQYASGHLPQAQNIPAAELEEKYKSIPPGKTIAYYGGSELETFQAGVTLFNLGLPGGNALEGGIEEWKKKGFPIEK